MYTYVLLSDYVCAMKSLCSLEINHHHFLSTSALWKHLRLHLYLGCQERTFTDVAEQTEEGEKMKNRMERLFNMIRMASRATSAGKRNREMARERHRAWYMIVKKRQIDQKSALK